MKKILVCILFLIVGLSLSAQNLHVQLINGEQQDFSFVTKPKITFGQNTMIVASTAETKNFQVNQIRNLSFNSKSAIAMQLDDKIQIYPNPVKDELVLNFLTDMQNMEYQLFDISGKQIKSDRLHLQSNTINMQNFRTGTYVLYLSKDGQFVQSFKIVKQ